MLLGRTVEERRLADLIGAARDGRSGCVIVRGPAGIGKSELLASIRHREGLSVIEVAGVSNEREIGFAALHRLLHPLLASAAELGNGQRRALENAFAEGDGGTVDPLALAAATLSLLAGAGDDALLVVVEDAQLLDRASAATLVMAARRLERESVVIVMATRDPGFPVASGLPVIDLGPLEERPARQILRTEARNLEPNETIAPAVLRRLLDDCGGNPFKLVHAARGMTREQLLGKKRLSSVLLRRDRWQEIVDRVPVATDTAAFLLEAAVADTEALTVFGRLPGGGDAVGAAEARGILVVDGRVIRFTDPLIHEAIVAAASPAELRAAHAKIAATMTAPRYRARRAIHMGHAALGPDEDVASELEWAGSEVERRGGPAGAWPAYERAAQLSPADGDRCRRLLAGASAARLAAEADSARRLLAEAGEFAQDAAQRADCEHLGAVLDLGQLRPVAVLDRLQRAVDEIAPVDPRRAAAMLITAGSIAPPEERVAMLTRAVELAGPERDALWVRARLCLAAALRAVDRPDEAGPYADGGIAALEADPAFADDPDLLLLAARAGGELDGGFCERAVHAARSRQRTAVIPHALLALAGRRELEGQWDAATGALEDAVELFRASGQESVAAAAAGELARLSAMRGDADRHETWLSAAAEGLSPEDFARLAAYCAGALCLSRADLPGARAALADVASTDDGAIGLLALADLADAGETVAAPDRHHPWLVARLAAATAGDDIESLERAVALAAELAPLHPYHRARVELTAARALRKQRRLTRAKDLIDSAWAAFERLGAVAWARRCDDQAVGPATSGHRGDRDALTRRERQVAVMRAAGMPYKEIAGHLYLSFKAVDYHVQNIRRKTGTSNPVELINWLDTHPE